MPKCALPERLRDPKNWKGTDWDNFIQRPLMKIRHWFTFGPNCEQGWTIMFFFIPWTPIIFLILPVRRKWRRFPKLLFGYNVTRWMGQNDKSVLFIGNLVGKWVFPWTKLENLNATEMKGDSPDFQQPIFMEKLGDYGPSPIQYWADVHFAVTWPLHVVFSLNKKKKRPEPGEKRRVPFFRWGCRWDSGDDYYQAPAAAAGTDFN